MRKGSKISHTTGYSISARIAKGAHNINKISQSKKVIILQDYISAKIQESRNDKREM